MDNRQQKMAILNLGCGQDIRKDAINCDVTNYPGVDQVVDLSVFPWPWADESMDGIHASHVIEHFTDQQRFILECLRVLKKGGFLRLKLPHSSNVSAVGCLGHYRTFAYNTMDDYLGREFYMFKKQYFKTIEKKLLWWYETVNVQKDVPNWMVPIIKSLNYILSRLAKLSPRICENLWCYWVGGFREVIWKGEKL